MTVTRPHDPATAVAAPQGAVHDLRRRLPHAPRRRAASSTRSAAAKRLFPLIVLVGLVGVNQLDQTAFGILAPDIRDAFRLSNQGFLALVAVTQLGGLLLSVPLAYYSDRIPRVALAVIGAAIWAVFGFFTAFAFTTLMLVIVRSGAGMRPRRDHADAQLAALRLLPAAGTTRRVRVPRDRPRDRRDDRAARRRPARPVVRLAACPFVVFVIPTIVFVHHGLAAEGARPRPLRTRRRGRERRRSSTPTRCRRRSRSRSASSGRSARCGGSGTRCRSSRPRSSASSRSRRCSTSRCSTSTTSSAASSPRSPNPRRSSRSCSASRSRRG